MTAPGATEQLERGTQLLRRFATAGVVLVFAVIVASAYLRLTQSGLGCADWPACYGAAPSLANPVAEPPLLIGVIRVTHRISAAAVGFVVIVITVVCFGAARRSFKRRLVAGLLLGLTLFLALLGTATPGAQLPAVTLGNLLGGMALLGLFWWLRHEGVSAPPAPRAPVPAPWTWFGLALLAVQIALGGLVSARFAALACTTFPDCNGAWWPPQATLALLDPSRVPDALPAVALIADPARQALHMTHRFGALIVFGYWAALAAIALRSRRASASRVVLTAVLLAIQIALGAFAVLLELPLVLAIAHNALAALVILAAVSAVFQSRPADAASVSAACQIVTSK